MNALPWVVYPYLAVTVFVVGHFWRWRFDKLGWTSRSSQLFEQQWLRIGSPLFHIGLLGVLGGHVIGILTPKSLTESVGVHEQLYHWFSIAAGGTFGMLALVGILILTLRRLLVPAVRRNGSVADIAVDLMLLIVIALGESATLGYQLGIHAYDYRETVSVWFRQLLMLHPDASIASSTPRIYQAHIIAAFTLFGLWPFSRLVHVWTVPLQYIVRRAHILYRGSPATSPS